MPKDQPSNASFKSRSLSPYPSLSRTQEGRISVSSTRPSSRSGPASQQRSIEGIGFQLSSSHPPHVHSGETSTLTQHPPPTHSNLSTSPAESITPSPRALTASRPSPQSASLGNVAPQPSEGPGEGRRNLVANDVGTTPSVYDGSAQALPSCPLHVRVETDPVFNRSSAWTVQDPGAIMGSLPLLRVPTAPPAPSPHRLVENLPSFGSGSMPEPSLPSLYSPYPQLPPSHSLGAVSDATLTLSYPWEGMDQFSPYPTITIESANPQLPAASTIDILPEISSQWTAEDLELLLNPPHLVLPHDTSIDDLPLGSSQGSLMAANVPDAWPPPSHHPSSEKLRSVPSFHSSFGEGSLIHSSRYVHTQPPPPRPPPISLDIDTVVAPSRYSSATQSMQDAESTVRSLPPPSPPVVPGASPSRGVSLLHDPLYPHLPPHHSPRVLPRVDSVMTPTSHAHPGIAFETPRQLGQPLPEAPVPPRIPPRSPSKPLLRDPQHRPSHFLDRAQPVHVVEAHEPLPPPSSVDTARSGGSFLRNAHNFRTGDWHVDYSSRTTVVTSGLIDGWKILQEHTAPNALHNSDARYDAPKCDEDTRIEVTAEIMGWIKDRAHPQRLLCMTGAAGSGKSALQQSIAECCAKDNILGGAYFISAADPGRNTASTIVPTIAYQLGLNHSILQRSVAAAVVHDPLIFSRSLETQMDALVVRPFESFRREYDTTTFPYSILIDGLDECQGEPITTTDLRHGNTVTKCKAEDRQAELLSAIKNSLLKHDLPFRIFIASRPEWAIHTALGTGGSLHGLTYHIPLSDKYDATEDMRRYLRRRFQDIGLRINQPGWFTEGNIETLVRAGSGQFVYVATVFKYVSERRASPPHRLKTVLDWTPGQVTRPFEALDMLYTNVLLRAKEAYEAVDTHWGRDFLLLLKIYLLDIKGSSPAWGLKYIASDTGSDVVSALLDLESDALDILTLDLRSLVHVKEDRPGIRYLAMYHKSLCDFMDEPSRAKDLFVPVSPVCMHLAKCCIRRIIESPELELHPMIPVHRNNISFSKSCVPLAIYCLGNFLPGANLIDDEIVDFTHKGGWYKIDMGLFKDSGFGVIFEGKRYTAWSWADHLDKATEDLKKRRPEVAEIVSKYVQKWKHFAN